MNKRQFELSTDEEQALITAYDQSRDGPTRTRYQAVRLYGSGYATEAVLSITGCSRSSLMQWCRAYRAGGVAALEDHRAGGNRAKLTAAQLAELHTKLHQYTPRDVFGPAAATASGQFWTVPDVARGIQKWYGVQYHSHSSYCRLLTLCGFSYQQPAKVYKSHSATKVAEFAAELEKKCSISPKRPPKP